MIVEKMHVASIHYAVLEFEETVLLTDIIFPPCKPLASVSISIWKSGESPEDGKVIAYSDEISKKALVQSSIVKPLTAKYLKVKYNVPSKYRCNHFSKGQDLVLIFRRHLPV